MLKILGDEADLYRIVRNAFEASKAVGLGKLHFNPNHSITLEEFEECGSADKNEYYFDYVKGRMVKLYIFRKKAEGSSKFYWYLKGTVKPDVEYQSWAHKYPTWRSLVQSADVECEEELF